MARRHDSVWANILIPLWQRPALKLSRSSARLKTEKIHAKKIELEKPATPPNVITPNGDGKNDTFNVGAKLETIEIYNRWGQAILKTNAYQNDWGKDIPVGTYYYYLKTIGGAECKGWVEIL